MQEFINLISNNITELRKQNALTQVEFGALLNYSDKSISKWERGDALPDLIVLKKMSDVFEVPIEYFFSEHTDNEKTFHVENKFIGHRIALSLLVVCFAYILATAVYIYTKIYKGMHLWIAFVWAIPLSLIGVLLVNQKLFDGKYNLVLASASLWTILAALYLQFLEYNIWIIFFLGVPLQAAFILIRILRSDLKSK